MYEEIVREAVKTLRHRDLTDNVTLFGGHHLHARIDDSQPDQQIILWCEFLRIVDPLTNSSLVFRLLTRDGIDNVLFDQVEDESTPIVVLDNIPNIHREVDSGEFDRAFLLNSYVQLMNKEISAVITPVREGALGETEERAGIEPFTTDEYRYPTSVWDIPEEVAVAQAIYGEMSGAVGTYTQALVEVTQRYTAFAQPFVNFLGAEVRELHQARTQLPKYDSAQVDFPFFTDQPLIEEVTLASETQRVEQVVAYPYPTDKGMLYIRLIRVWDAENQKFSVVRVIQTQPDLAHIDGLRIDSNCTDGVHSLDCHCDCHAQLWQALNMGLEQGKNIVVIELEDDEGKGHGTVMKGITLEITRRINEILAAQGKSVGTAYGSDLFYSSLDLPHDLRTFNAAIATMKFLGITEVDTLLMGNSQKVNAVESAGVTFHEAVAVEIPASDLTSEAAATLREKHAGVVVGPGGIVVRYAGSIKPNTVIN